MLTQNASDSARGPAAAPGLGQPRIAGLLSSSWLLAGTWLAAIASWMWQADKALAPSAGGDLDAIRSGVVAFVHHQPVYFQGHDYFMAFLYPPSALPLLAPLGLLSLAHARAVMAVCQIAAICVGGWLSVELTGRRERLAVPLVALGLSLYMPARNGVWLGNVDGFILAGEAALLLAAARGRWMLAALVMGLTLALKPALVPLLILFLLRRRLIELAVAVSVPATLSILALTVTRDPLSFLTQVVPFVLHGQSASLQAASVSLSSAAITLGLPPPAVLALRVAALGTAAAVFWMRWRQPLPEGVRLAESAGIVMLATLLSFSYAWAHYGLFLVPLLALIGTPLTVVRGLGSLAALYLIGSPVDPVLSTLSPRLGWVRMTVGLVVLLVALAVAAVRSRGPEAGKSFRARRPSPVAAAEGDRG